MTRLPVLFGEINISGFLYQRRLHPFGNLCGTNVLEGPLTGLLYN